MYDRAPRTLTQPSRGTTHAVGPGTYEAPETLRQRYDAYAPFLSMTGRETFLDVNDSVIAAPGPGQYDPGQAQFKVVGGHTLANRSGRFAEKETKTPGPGAYNLQKKKDWIREVPVTKPEEDGADGTIYKTSRITFKRKPDPPSIPSPGKAYGYEEAPDGSLRRQDLPEKDASLGPAYYNVRNSDTGTSTKYKGTHFSNRTSRRMEFKGSGGPGPGDYDPYTENPEDIPMEILVKESKRQPFESMLPRYHEVITRSEEKKAVPGPGKYEIKSQFERQNRMAVSTMPDDTVTITAPFGSQAKRSDQSKHQSPAPGTYNDPRNSLEVLRRTTGLKRSPFGQTSVRFQARKHHSQKTPGPASYHIPDMSTDLLKKAHFESSRKGAFGTTSNRIGQMTRRHEDQLPGPAHYMPQERSRKEITSTFKSTTERLKSPIQAAPDAPPPGSYEVRKSYDNTQGRVLYPHTEKSKRFFKKPGAFMSTASRFPGERKLPSDEVDPGPGQYEYLSKAAVGGLMVSRDTRFKREKNEVPGPGAYELSPVQANTLLRGTFNATLHNPVTISYDETDHRTPSKQAFLLGV